MAHWRHRAHTSVHTSVSLSQTKRESASTHALKACLLLFVSFCLCVCVFVFVGTGRLTAARRCPHACRWSHVHVRRSVCSPLCPTPTPPSARWRDTWGPDSCVTSSWWPETGGYLHTGKSKDTKHASYGRFWTFLEVSYQGTASCSRAQSFLQRPRLRLRPVALCCMSSPPFMSLFSCNYHRKITIQNPQKIIFKLNINPSSRWKPRDTEKSIKSSHLNRCNQSVFATF